MRDDLTLVRDQAGQPLEMIGSWLDITDRRRAEEELRLLNENLARLVAERTRDLEESESSLREAQRLAHVGSWSVELLTGRGSWSDEMYRIFGIDKAESAGSPADMFEAAVHPDDRAQVAEGLARAVREGVSVTDAFRVVRLDGGVVHVLATVEAVLDPDGRPIRIQGATQDVTERVVAEQALARSEAELRRAQAVARMGSWYVNLATMRGRWSAEMHRIMGVPEGTTASFATVLEMSHPEDRGGLEESWAGAMRGRPFELEHRILLEGREVWLRTRADVETTSDRRPTRAIGTSQDITEHRAVEAELRQSQKMRAVGQLAGGVAHEFNNLLTAIRGYSELIQLGLPAGEEQLEADIDEVIANVGRAADLTRGLLAVSRRQVLQPRVIDPAEVVETVVPLLGPLLGQQVELVIAADPGHGFVKVDPGQLEHVIVILAVNARDAMPSGGRLTIDLDPVEIDEEQVRAHPDTRPGPFVRLRVSDTGVGMSHEVLVRVFEPFFTTKRVGEGTGLGLATAYGIIEQSGGTITAESTPGAGSTFTVHLPRLSKQEEPHQGRRPSEFPSR